MSVLGAFSSDSVLQTIGYSRLNKKKKKKIKFHYKKGSMAYNVFTVHVFGFFFFKVKIYSRFTHLSYHN